MVAQRLGARWATSEELAKSSTPHNLITVRDVAILHEYEDPHANFGDIKNMHNCRHYSVPL